jgi:cell division septal protein FtsQ
VCTAVVVLAPLGLREVSFFRVRQVELLGVRYLAPESVLVALTLEPDRNLFDALRPVERRAESIPGVVRARAQRRLPGTLRLIVEEREAVAFAPGSRGLVPLDEGAAPLPYDPAQTGLDLPLIPRPDTLVARALWRVRVSDSALFREVRTARRAGRDAVVLDLGALELVVDDRLTPQQLRAVGAVRTHLAERGERVRRLDARFAGRVIARRGGA